MNSTDFYRNEEAVENDLSRISQLWRETERRASPGTLDMMAEYVFLGTIARTGHLPLVELMQLRDG